MNLQYLALLRPTQWLKNLMLLFPVFLAGHALQPGVVGRAALPFLAFCLVSSAGYVFNDLLDQKRDALHPKKRLRAIPSGAVTVPAASLYAGALMLTGFALSIVAAPAVVVFLAAYAGISLLYSSTFKSMPVVDLFCISAGFLLRLQAGGALFGILISPWLFLSVFLLAIFLSTGKRLSEVQSLGEGAGEHRASLARYPDGFLAGTLYLTGGSVLVTYAMYSVLNAKLIYTVPLCLFGLLRYILRVSSGGGGDPTESLLKDWVLFLVSLVWLLMVIWSIYW